MRRSGGSKTAALSGGTKRSSTRSKARSKLRFYEQGEVKSAKNLPAEHPFLTFEAAPPREPGRSPGPSRPANAHSTAGHCLQSSSTDNTHCCDLFPRPCTPPCAQAPQQAPACPLVWLYFIPTHPISYAALSGLLALPCLPLQLQQACTPTHLQGLSLLRLTCGIWPWDSSVIQTAVAI